MPTNPASQNAYAPQHGIPPFSLQAQLQPVMMQKCITPFFSQEYCFSENPGLSASSGWPSAHSAPSEFFDTVSSGVAPELPNNAAQLRVAAHRTGDARHIGCGLSTMPFRKQQAHSVCRPLSLKKLCFLRVTAHWMCLLLCFIERYWVYTSVLP